MPDDDRSGRGGAELAAELEGLVAIQRGDRRERLRRDLDAAATDLAHVLGHGAARVSLDRHRATLGPREAGRRLLVAAVRYLQACDRTLQSRWALYIKAHQLAEERGLDSPDSDRARYARVRRACPE